MKTSILKKVSVRLYFDANCICLGGLALEIHSEKFNFNGDYHSSQDAEVYPSQDIEGKTWSIINKERVELWYDSVRAPKISN